MERRLGVVLPEKNGIMNSGITAFSGLSPAKWRIASMLSHEVSTVIRQGSSWRAA